MDNRQWNLLKDRLLSEVTVVLAPLLTSDWTPETNKEANKLLSKRAEKLMAELKLPPIPEGHRLFAKIWFNGKVSPPKMKLSVYHVPWNKGGARSSRPQPARKPLASPLKAEDPLGVVHRADTILCDYEYAYVLRRLYVDAKIVLKEPMKLDELRRREPEYMIQEVADVEEQPNA